MVPEKVFEKGILFFLVIKRTYVCIYRMKSMKPLIQIGIGATEMNVAKQAEEA